MRYINVEYFDILFYGWFDRVSRPVCLPTLNRFAQGSVTIVYWIQPQAFDIVTVTRDMTGAGDLFPVEHDGRNWKGFFWS